jgi:hypothetical protein
VNSVALQYARGLVGSKIGGYLVKAVVKESNDTLRMVCECTTCGQSNKMTLAVLQTEERSLGRVRCQNYQRHPVAPKAVTPNWKQMNDGDFNKFVSSLSSEVYKGLFSSKDGQLFQRRVNCMSIRPKTREEGLANKAAAAREKERTAAQKVVAKLFNACLWSNHKMPFEGGIDGWIALPQVTKDEIIRYYELDTKNWSVIQ